MEEDHLCRSNLGREVECFIGLQQEGSAEVQLVSGIVD